MLQGLHDHLANIIVAYAAINITQINKVNGQAHSITINDIISSGLLRIYSHTQRIASHIICHMLNEKKKGTYFCAYSSSPHSFKPAVVT